MKSSFVLKQLKLVTSLKLLIGYNRTFIMYTLSFTNKHLVT